MCDVFQLYLFTDAHKNNWQWTILNMYIQIQINKQFELKRTPKSKSILQPSSS